MAAAGVEAETDKASRIGTKLNSEDRQGGDGGPRNAAPTGQSEEGEALEANCSAEEKAKVNPHSRKVAPKARVAVPDSREAKPDGEGVRELTIETEDLDQPDKAHRRVSENGSVVIHSNASDSPLEISEGMQKLLIPSPHQQPTRASSDLHDGTALDAPAKAEQESEGSLEADFEELDIKPDAEGAPNGHAKEGLNWRESGRTGVTVTPPLTPKSFPQSDEQPRAASENLPKQGRSNVAEELAEAEARADEAALAASQRASSIRDQLNKEAGAAGESQDAPFIEEALHHGEAKRTDGGEPQSEANAQPTSPQPRALEVSEAEVQSYEPPEYQGLVFHDGVDSMGRPVVVINADALAPGISRKDAVSYMQQRLEPIVVQGPYVLIFLSCGSNLRNKVTPGWLASCYRQMSYPFKKNVKFVILVRPSATLRFMLAIMRPLVKPKAFHKIKKVPNLTAISGATNAEVTMQHLGTRFSTTAGQGILEGEMASLGSSSSYQMPNFSDAATKHLR